MSLQRAGFFRELRHGAQDGPSLHESVGSLAKDHAELVAAYLEAAPVLVATGTMVDDIMDLTNRGVAPLEIATDGEWVWPRDLGYYVRHYRVAIPAAFLDRIRSQKRPPRISAHELRRLGGDYVAPDHG
jgi:hypothetical protein